MSNTPQAIFAAAAVTFFTATVSASTINSILKYISVDAPQISTFQSFIGFVIFAGLTLYLSKN